MTSEANPIIPTSSSLAAQPPSASISSQSAPTPAPALASTSQNGNKRKQKKVRSACERCRYRRVKCDGQVPSCSSCLKAGAPCIDVDNHDAERRLMRGSAEQAAARITWLESIIRTQLPHLNLDDGIFASPQADNFAGVLDNTLPVFDISSQNPSTINLGSVQESVGLRNEFSVSNRHLDPTRGTKRPVSILNEDSTSREDNINREARSVALELGLLSLNSDSRQRHYLGSSSGSLFAPLFLAKKSSNSSVTAHNTLGSRQNDSGRSESLNARPELTLHAAGIRKDTDSLYELLRKILPSRDESNTLLNRFFSHMHPNHPFLHRPSFNYMINTLYQCIAATEITASSKHNGWCANVEPFPYNGEEYLSEGQKRIPISAHIAAFQLLMALSIGATLQIRGRRYSHDPKLFFNSAIGLSSHVFGSISLPALQCILLVIVHGLIDSDGCDVWTLIHIAMAHVVDLGIQRETSNSDLFSPTAIEMRRRIFFCVYSLDRSICTIQGRPLGLGDETFDVQLPEISEAQMQLLNSQVPSDEFDDICTMSYSIQTFKMARLISRIKSGFYRLPTHIDFSQDHSFAQDRLRAELANWFVESIAAVSSIFPEHNRTRLATKLKIQYHGAMCLLHQPSQAIALPGDEALKICFSSATKRLHLFEVLYDSGALCHSWRTVQDMFLAGATIMYCVCISPAVRASVSIISLSKDFRACSSMLSVGGEWWPTIRKAKYSLERLSNYILEMLAAKGDSDESQMRARQGPFPQDYIPNIAGWPESISIGPEAVQQTFLDLVNHDGRMIDFFDETLTTVLMDEMQHTTQTEHMFQPQYLEEFDRGMFEHGTWT
ncbi:fungal-specific transcription factor domain-containing protein [Bisporella sp. PMI_857]|nr:fungal-specific transcription factor domain-containing protein [Bisporella sp. PMI_857]